MCEFDGIIYADDPTPILNVVALRPLPDMKLWARLNNGTAYVTDMTPLLTGEVFQPLADPAVFNDVNIVYGVPSWLNGEIDVAPEWLADNGEIKET